MNPGRYTDLTNEQYHKSPGISKSGLAVLARSPEHYQQWLNEREEPKEDSKALIVGTAVHTAVLEPGLFAEKYAPFDDRAICFEIGGAKPRATNEYKAWLAEFKAQNEGRIILEGDDYRYVTEIAESVRSRPTSRTILGALGAAEHSFFWEDPATGVLCKCRPDYLREDGYIVDLKTTDDASPKAFERDAEKYRYYMQAAFYMAGVRNVLGVDVKGFVFVVVEKKPPYAVAFYAADADMITSGEAEICELLQRYRTCEEFGAWPGYPEEILPLARPAWAEKVA